MIAACMAEKLHLRPAQPPMVKFIRDVKRCGLYAGMGIGKSSAVLYALESMRILGEIDPRNPVLVIGPARVARDTWSDEVAKWTDFAGYRIVPLHGTPTVRLAKLKQKADIFTISYELLPWLVEYWLAKWPYRVVIADELERLKGFREQAHGTNLRSSKSGASGKRAHAIGRIAHNLTDRWINLGGTPAPAGLKDLWGSTWFLDRGVRLGRTYTDFKNRWFRLRWSGQGIEPLPFAAAEIQAALADICLTVDPKDYYDLKAPIINDIRITLPPKARALFERMKRDLFVEIEARGGIERIDALTAAGLMNKGLQIGNGFLFTKHPAWEKVHDAKLEALESIISEAGGMPILVQTSFIPDKQRILARFKGARDLSTSAGLKGFKAGDVTIGVAHPSSMGHGIDGLQYITNQLVRYGHVWKLSETMQMLERIGPMRQHQAGLDRAVWEHRIIADDTFDDSVLQVHKANGRVQDALLLALNRFKISP
jgi:SNF2-related domain